MTTSIRAQYAVTIFSKEHFKIGKYNQIDDDGRDIGQVTILGDDLPEKKNITYKFDGEWHEGKYGRQFNTTGFVLSIGATRKEVTNYLRSLKGIGEATANKVVDALGIHALDIITNDPLRLETIGLPPKKVAAIKEAWQENTDITKIYNLLSPYGVTPSISAKIVSEYGVNAEDTIKHHPYQLLEITGLTWDMADAIAYDQKTDPLDLERYLSAAYQVLVDNEINGHTGMPPKDFVSALVEKLNGGRFAPIDRKTIAKIANYTIRTDGTEILITGADGEAERYVYRWGTRHVEKGTAILISNRHRKYALPNDFENTVSYLFRKEGLEPDESQIEAVKTALGNQISIITGGPGTGKTTVVKIIEDAFPAGTTFCYLAPTGKAARRLSQSVEHRAYTIHSKLRLYDTDNDDCNVETIPEDVIVLDEASMVDIRLMHKLMSAMKIDSRLILLGDPAQLQSVDCGAVLRDMIDSNMVPVATLNTIHRQSDGSAIIENAARIAEGNNNLVTGKDFEVHDHLKGDILIEAMVSAYINDIKEYGKDQVICLAGTREQVKMLNERIQANVNPPDAITPEIKQGGRILRFGDRVMMTKNQDNVANGDTGYIIGVNEETKAVIVRFYDSIDVTYEKEMLDDIQLAYAMTVHKSQGSEYASVITCMVDNAKHMKIRSVVYTAITRAKEVVRFFGSYRALQDAVLIDDKDKRKTLLRQDLIHYQGISLWPSAGY